MPVRLDGLARRRRAALLGVSVAILKARERRERERAQAGSAWIGQRIMPSADAPTTPRTSPEKRS